MNKEGREMKGLIVAVVVSLSLCACRTPTIPAAAETAFPSSRDVFTWGSSFDSPWNLPLSVNAVLRPVGLAVGGLLPTPDRIYVDGADLSISPTYPLKTLSWGLPATFTGPPGSAVVHTNPTLSADGSWNNSGAFLLNDGITVIEGQTTKVSPGGNPTFSGMASVAQPGYNLKSSQGIAGSHGGSGLSCLGGTLRMGELTGPNEIYHAVGGGLDAMRSYSQSTGHVWPATSQDGYYRDGGAYAYGGPDSAVAPGSLLVLSPTFDELTLCLTRAGQKLARSMKRYGFYCKDDTYWLASHQIEIDVQDTQALAVVASPSFQNDWKTIFSHCYVVTNNSASTPGGGPVGDARRMPYAPPFSDGTGAPPPSPMRSESPLP